jgi:hypothetical protein
MLFCCDCDDPMGPILAQAECAFAKDSRKGAGKSYLPRLRF